MEHPLNKSAVSSLPYDPTAIRKCADHFNTLDGSVHTVFNPCSETTLVDKSYSIVNTVCEIEFYGVPADVIKTLIREHLPEYVL